MEHDRGGKLTDVQLLSKKMNQQMNAASGQHNGIYDLLSELRDENIIRNLPFDNIKRGIKSSKITDEDVLQRLEESAAAGGGRGVKRKTAPANKGDDAEDDCEITYTETVTMLSGEGDDGTSCVPSSKGSDSYRAVVQSSLPEHLQGGSRVQAVACRQPSAPPDIDKANGERGKDQTQDQEEEDEDWED